jgi:Ca2+-transporting ATPase
MDKQNPFAFKGLTDVEVAAARKRYGSNIISQNSANPLLLSLWNIVREPMFLILVACSMIYFVLGEPGEGWFMLAAVIFISAISFFQDQRGRKALQALQEYTLPNTTVIRNNLILSVATTEIVVGDFIVVDEGALIPADGLLRQSNDFSVNESILTGEAFSVAKNLSGNNNRVYSGTLAETGQCVFEVTAVGGNTQLGQIGGLLDNVGAPSTPLQSQINSFVKTMSLVGGLVFLLIWLVNYYRSGQVMESLLKGLTIAMSVLPEEIPVAFATFMALGAMRLLQKGVIVKQPGTVETLGSMTVLCTDKTGTITQNKMVLKQVYDFATDAIYTEKEFGNEPAHAAITAAMWASEPAPFDPMEKALHETYGGIATTDERPYFKMAHEYPLQGSPPMMTHVFEDAGKNRVIACKGAPEAVIAACQLTEEKKQKILEINRQLAGTGLRVLGVAVAPLTHAPYPATQHEIDFDFTGLVAFYDPPKKDAADVFESLYKAGISIRIITGDNPLTASAIAKEIGMQGYDKVITGEQLSAMPDAQFDDAVSATNIFARMFPAMKLKVVQSLKKQGMVVGMTGDGVNDGPALKAAHIGVAMGRRGSETARRSAAMILTDDNLSKMVEAVAMGRKIYSNLKKAIQYIISIHIPIILTVAVPTFAGWLYPSILTPVHIIFLELVMGPTCSIVYENEPLEKNAMLLPPRPTTTTFLSFKELVVSLFQGTAITAAVLAMYQFSASHQYPENMARSMVFSTLVLANIFLTLANRSFYYSILQTLRYANNLLAWMLSITASLLALLLYTPALSGFFKLAPLNAAQVGLCIVAASLPIIGFELYKWMQRKKHVPVPEIAQ